MNKRNQYEQYENHGNGGLLGGKTECGQYFSKPNICRVTNLPVWMMGDR